VELPRVKAVNSLSALISKTASCLASYVFCGSCAYGNIVSEAGVERFAVVL
jgi:hypothetical protein